jgi:protein SCO1/2
MKYFFSQLFIFGLFSLSSLPGYAKDFPGDSVFHLKGEWLNQDGKAVHIEDLQGRVTAVAMVYTSCQFACPMIVEEMNRIKAKLSPQILPKVSFVLISMDPQRDTPEKLKSFASKRNLDLSFWRLYTPKSERQVREFSAVIGANIKKVGKDFAHSNMITILNPEGVIVFTKPSLGQQIDETVSSISSLAMKVGP